MLFSDEIIWKELPQKSWYPMSGIMGIFFILIFYFIGKTSQINGISVASVATKMSVIIPVSAGLILYQEKITLGLVVGIFLALVAVFLTAKKESTTLTTHAWQYPLIAFLGAGSLDATLQFIQKNYLPAEEIILFSAHTFAVAFVTGILFTIFQRKNDHLQIKGKNILAGLALGLPNFGSLYFMILMLKEARFESAMLFSIHNVSIVLASTFISWLFFKETLSKNNIVGILIAVISIILMTFSS
jgi:drug/metabolite transporter (DMT)-like permease